MKKREKFIGLAINEEQYESVVNEAEKLNLSVSGFIRMMIFERNEVRKIIKGDKE